VLAWHRAAIWQAVVKIWMTRPVTGIGPGGLVEAAGPERILHPDQVGRYQFVVKYAESTPLAVLVQVGVVGFVLVMVGSGLWWFQIRRSKVLGPESAVAAMLAVVVFGLFHDLLTIDPVLLWWAATFGCLMPLNARASSRMRRGRRWRASQWVFALALSWLTAWGIATPALARLTWSTVQPTTPNVERVLRIEPWLADAPARRVETLLKLPESWTWTDAAEALHWARTGVEVHPGLARWWANLGRVHLRILTDLEGTKHDVSAAEGALRRACELDPHLPWHWLERARFERIVGRHQQAIRWAKRALAEEPNTVRAWLTLGRLELEDGDVAAARDAYEQAVQRSALIHRPGLTAYEMELLEAPPRDLHRMERRLAAASTSSEVVVRGSP
jgi:hypothetical protein